VGNCWSRDIGASHLQLSHGQCGCGSATTTARSRSRLSNRSRRRSRPPRRRPLALWAEVANITFEQVTETPSNVGEIRFGNSAAVTNSPYVAWGYYPYKAPGRSVAEDGDVWFDKKDPGNLKLNPGQEGFETMLHEIGHALGLDHPFSDGYGEPILDLAHDTDQYTVMSYNYEQSTMAYVSTRQMLDILAIQYIYGANMTTRTGDRHLQVHHHGGVQDDLDAGGNDTLDFSNQSGAAVQGTLQEGTFFRFGGHPTYGTTSIVGIAYGVTIENVNRQQPREQHHRQ
jgi:serralysin